MRAYIQNNDLRVRLEVRVAVVVCVRPGSSMKPIFVSVS